MMIFSFMLRRACALPEQYVTDRNRMNWIKTITMNKGKQEERKKKDYHQCSAKAEDRQEVVVSDFRDSERQHLEGNMTEREREGKGKQGEMKVKC